MTTATLNPIALDGHGAPTAYEWLCLDIETVGGRPEEAERWMRLNWSPSPTLKPDTIGRKYLELLEAKRDKLALLDGAKVICISLRSDTELRCLHCLKQHGPVQVHGGLVEGFADMAGMLIAARNLLDAMVTPETVIVGHNIKHFDLPMLRHAYVREGLRQPLVLTARDVQVYDTMVEYGYRFSLIDKPFISLADLLENFGMQSHKSIVDGSQVGELYEKGEFDTIIQYAMLDVISESNVFLRMTGQADGLR